MKNLLRWLRRDPSRRPATLRDLDYLERQVAALQDEMEQRFNALDRRPVHMPSLEDAWRH